MHSPAVIFIAEGRLELGDIHACMFNILEAEVSVHCPGVACIRYRYQKNIFRRCFITVLLDIFVCIYFKIFLAFYDKLVKVREMVPRVKYYRKANVYTY
jgi:hypothetical protein